MKRLNTNMEWAMSEEQFAAHIENYYDELYNAIEASKEWNDAIPLDPNFPHQIKSVIVYYGHFDSLGDEFFTIPPATIKKKDINKGIENAITYLQKYAPDLLDINPFIEREPYDPPTQYQVKSNYRRDYIRKLTTLGLTVKKSKEILDLLDSLYTDTI